LGGYTRRPHSAPLQNHTISAHSLTSVVVIVTPAFHPSFRRTTRRRRWSGWRVSKVG